MNSRVTILIPNLNGDKYLSAALDSCLMQTYRCEVIVVDNGSIDGSLDILDSYSARFPNIVKFEFSGGGISGALNYGLEKSSREFICRLDSDDFMESNRVEIQLKYLEAHPEVQLVGSQVKYVDHQGLGLGLSSYPIGSQNIERALAISNPIAHPSVMIRKSAVIAAGGYRARYNGAEDFDLWMRVIKVGKIDNLSLPLTNYRRHPSQESVRKNLYAVELRVRKQYVFNVLFRNSSSLIFKCLFLLRTLDLLFMARGFDLHRKVLRKLKSL